MAADHTLQTRLSDTLEGAIALATTARYGWLVSATGHLGVATNGPPIVLPVSRPRPSEGGRGAVPTLRQRSRKDPRWACSTI